MSESTAHTEGRKAIQALLDRIENDEWAVVDYNPNIDPYEQLSVSVEIERRELADVDADIIGDGEKKTVKDVVRFLENKSQDGAQLESVIDVCADKLNLDRETTLTELEVLRTKGEVYEPKEDHLHAT